MREKVLSLLFIDNFFAECIFYFIVDFLFVLTTEKCETRPYAVNLLLFGFLNGHRGFDVDVFVVCDQLVSLSLLIFDNIDWVAVFEIKNVLFVPAFVSFVKHVQNLVA